jgi:hypothetical protein
LVAGIPVTPNSKDLTISFFVPSLLQNLPKSSHDLSKSFKIMEILSKSLSSNMLVKSFGIFQKLSNALKKNPSDSFKIRSDCFQNHLIQESFKILPDFFEILSDGFGKILKSFHAPSTP